MTKDEVPIATRTFLLNGNESVIAKIWQPFPDPESNSGTDYKCNIQILGIGDEKIRYAVGVDQFQALVLAMQRLGTLLYCSNEYKSGALQWLDMHDLGIPMPTGAEDYIFPFREHDVK